MNRDTSNLAEINESYSWGEEPVLPAGLSGTAGINTLQASDDEAPLCVPRWQGDDYGKCLQKLHVFLAPKRYLEIGVNQGATLSLASAASVGVDPNFILNRDVVGSKPACHLYQIRSDEFFADYDPKAILGGTVDLAFLDGLHQYETLLRDFSNTEKHCRNNSVIALHDCLPHDCRIAHRSQDISLRQGTEIIQWWAGDVWKTLLILKKYRPDLKFLCLTAPPTGLVLITNLNPSSTFLDENYFRITEEFRSVTLKEYGVLRFYREVGLSGTEILDSPERMTEYFWL